MSHCTHLFFRTPREPATFRDVRGGALPESTLAGKKKWLWITHKVRILCFGDTTPEIHPKAFLSGTRALLKHQYFAFGDYEQKSSFQAEGELVRA